MRVIDGTNETQLGVMRVQDAIRAAKQRGLDLVEVAPNANPPVCRIIDYGKFRYQQQKQEKDRKSASAKTAQKLKETKLRVNIDTHDYQIKMRRAEGFLMTGCKLRIQLQFKGREMAHQELGFKLLERVEKDLDGVAQVEMAPRKSGRHVTMVMAPYPEHKRKPRWQLADDEEETDYLDEENREEEEFRDVEDDELHDEPETFPHDPENEDGQGSVGKALEAAQGKPARQHKQKQSKYKQLDPDIAFLEEALGDDDDDHDEADSGAEEEPVKVKKAAPAKSNSAPIKSAPIKAAPIKAAPIKGGSFSAIKEPEDDREPTIRELRTHVVSLISDEDEDESKTPPTGKAPGIPAKKSAASKAPPEKVSPASSKAKETAPSKAADTASAKEKAPAASAQGGKKADSSEATPAKKSGGTKTAGAAKTSSPARKSPGSTAAAAGSKASKTASTSASSGSGAKGKTADSSAAKKTKSSSSAGTRTKPASTTAGTAAKKKAPGKSKTAKTESTASS